MFTINFIRVNKIDELISGENYLNISPIISQTK